MKTHLEVFVHVYSDFLQKKKKSAQIPNLMRSIGGEMEEKGI